MIECSIHLGNYSMIGVECQEYVRVQTSKEQREKLANTKSKKAVEYEKHQQFLAGSVHERKPRHDQSKSTQAAGERADIQHRDISGLDVIEEGSEEV